MINRSENRPVPSNAPDSANAPPTGADSARAEGIESVTPDLSKLSNGFLLRWMFSFLRPVRMLCVMACIYLCFAVTTEVFTVNQMGETINQIKYLHPGSANGSGFFGWFWGHDLEASRLRNRLGLLTALTLGTLILRYAREVSNAKLSMTMVYYIREGVYDKLQRVGFAFHDKVSTGQLINRALTDLQNVRVFLQTAVLVTLEIVLVVFGYMGLLFYRNPWVASLSLIPLPLWSMYILYFGKKVQPASKAVMEADDRNVSLITENIAGVHVVKAFATQQHEIEKYGQNCDRFFERVLARIRLYANFTPVIRAIATASHLSLIFAISIFIIRGTMDVGDILILGAAMGQVLGRLQQMAVISDQYQNAIVSSRRLYEVMMAPATVVDKPGAPELPAGSGKVTFQNVSFGYDPAKPVIKDVSFTVPGGSVVAIVGPTGAGKTTLVNLIARFYAPQRGRILIDGADIREVSLSSLRNQVAFVFQETYLFSDTVTANIAYGRPHITGGEVESASRLAQAHEFIDELPLKYQTMLGERGSSLSGGQKQRLAIARAILFNPRLLVLDDATAAVDPQTEHLIRKAMNYVMRDRTTFLIAHRISSVKRADVVIVLEEGRVTQIGTHDELMARDGHYREIAAVQLYGDEVAHDAEGDNPSHMKRVSDGREATATVETVTGQRRNDE